MSLATVTMMKMRALKQPMISAKATTIGAQIDMKGNANVAFDEDVCSFSMRRDRDSRLGAGAQLHDQ